ncbi:SRPBCC family protein [Fulvivirgaceae bacterium BMA10]|uniref:SRPBCC family protein n=1 Tax=Splendidivirga corallicola TaxID=3051826 RepID=A0ABT8KHP5_9BACT|nr:SRPBCC family protein [Fulvivirgaceae bacterium BMA10]
METQLIKNFDVQNIEINADPELVFDFVAEPRNIPKWAKAFTKADEHSAVLVTPNGELNIKMTLNTSKTYGVIDTVMTMPDGSIGEAYSRVTPNNNGKSAIFTFVLMAPPVPLEELEGTLEAQKLQLAEELQLLKQILENK